MVQVNYHYGPGKIYHGPGIIYHYGPGKIDHYGPSKTYLYDQLIWVLQGEIAHKREEDCYRYKPIHFVNLV